MSRRRRNRTSRRAPERHRAPSLQGERYRWNGSEMEQCDWRTILGRRADFHPSFAGLHPLEFAFYQLRRSNWNARAEYATQVAQSNGHGLPKPPRLTPGYDWITEFHRVDASAIAEMQLAGEPWEEVVAWRADVTAPLGAVPLLERRLFWLYWCGYSPPEIAHGPVEPRPSGVTLRALNAVWRLNLSAEDVRRRLRDLDRLVVGSVRGRFRDGDLLPEPVRERMRALLVSWRPAPRNTWRPMTPALPSGNGHTAEAAGVAVVSGGGGRVSAGSAEHAAHEAQPYGDGRDLVAHAGVSAGVTSGCGR